jgi:hypothetical protein
MDIRKSVYIIKETFLVKQFKILIILNNMNKYRVILQLMKQIIYHKENKFW